MLWRGEEVKKRTLSVTIATDDERTLAQPWQLLTHISSLLLDPALAPLEL